MVEIFNKYFKYEYLDLLLTSLCFSYECISSNDNIQASLYLMIHFSKYCTMKSRNNIMFSNNQQCTSCCISVSVNV